MKNFVLYIIFFLFLLSNSNQLGFSQQETVKEESTDKIFPKEVSFSYKEVDYVVTATGTAVKKMLIFLKIYTVIHYMQNPSEGNSEDIFTTILQDSTAKQLVLDFENNVSANKVKNAFKSGFTKRCTEEELKTIQPLVDQFLGYFNSTAKKNEQYIFRWLPNGTIISIIQGKEYPEISNITFARSLWKIWFGKDSTVNRDDLISYWAK